MSISLKELQPPVPRRSSSTDFMRGGGSIKGIVEILSEVDIEVVGIGVAIVSTKPEEEESQWLIFPSGYLGDVDENNKFVEVIPNCQIF